MSTKNLIQQAKEYEKEHPLAYPSQAWLDGYNAGLRKKHSKKQLNLSFVDADFLPAITTWLKYKNEKKQAYTQIGIEACYKRLIELSNNDPQTAMQIVNRSIANNWAGLFEINNGTTAVTTRSNNQFQSSGERKASVNDLADLAQGVLQGIGGKKR